ncbi:MAG: filamentous hemagglutinin N-terminal domain-containing protein [Pelatocladus maniniholoensis HA4357-MV3]|jgi:filamentous hemagglutinin family protein|uniref:Filamentous hemagglutinin N-terminal domain-containing protein n=1 Tax=Pelatocladus maniniholoensis HA4357-MV3 TaxID=1117104 RepID=A0A9E3HBI6_9NOST|nr:filamentous hemagglutinin N-terminal domain-containing protein [Pelatocladus maniniholoensis HA4357-MV3]
MRSLFVILPLVSLGWLASINTVRAQEVSSDGSLSTTVTKTVTNSNDLNFTIENGNRAGGNLFHSFSQFSVPNGGSAVFQNPVDVQNIISRVTGGSISNIDGLIRANGSANLFLINPAGIAFGPNASLSIGGSFFATTANSLLFGDGVEFSATNLATPPVLTVNIPIGLRFRDNPGSIQVQGDGRGLRSTTDLIDTTDGLRVQPDKTLALVGGNISLEGATLKTAGGRIELGSVAGEGQVSLTPINKGFSLGYDAATNLGNIQLSKQTAVDASGDGAGDMQVVSQRLTLTDGSSIEAGTLGSQSGGTLVVNVPESVDISDNYQSLYVTSS